MLVIHSLHSYRLRNNDIVCQQYSLLHVFSSITHTTATFYKFITDMIYLYFIKFCHIVCLDIIFKLDLNMFEKLLISRIEF